MDNSKQNDIRKNCYLAVLQGKNNKFIAGYGGLRSWLIGRLGRGEIDIRVEEMVTVSCHALNKPFCTPFAVYDSLFRSVLATHCMTSSVLVLVLNGTEFVDVTCTVG